MNFIHHWYHTQIDGATEDTTVGLVNLTFTNLYADNTNIVGEADVDYVNQISTPGATDIVTFNITGTLTEFELDQSSQPNWYNGFEDFDSCPCQGTVDADVSMSSQSGEENPAVTNWHVELTFTNGSAAVVITSGNTVWSYTQTVCELESGL
jgi:hypothetical protein